MIATRWIVAAVIFVLSAWGGRLLAVGGRPQPPSLSTRVDDIDRTGRDAESVGPGTRAAVGKAARRAPRLSGGFRRSPGLPWPDHIARRGDAWAEYVMQDLVHRGSLDSEVVSALLPDDGPGLAWVADYAACAALFPAEASTVGIRLRVKLSTTDVNLLDVEPYWAAGPPLSSQAMTCVARSLPSKRVVPRMSPVEIEPFEGDFTIEMPSPVVMAGTTDG